ncbi:MAG: hypothetical protein HY292_17910 [Planctomycetes bacterium]|nr:hypothetical protein [Planctomycetota bacterium]
MALDDDRVDRLLREGRITREEAERLRAAWLRSPEANVPLPRSPWLRPSRVAGVAATAAVLGATAFVAGRLLVLHGANLVRNAGFEEGGDVPRDWIAQNLSGDARFFAAVGEAPQGKRYGHIEKTSGRSFPIDSWTQDLGPVPASRRLAVSLWTRTRDAQRAVVDLQYYAAARLLSRRSVFEIPTTAPWTRLECEVPVPDAATSMSLSIQAPDSGIVDVDDVRVEAIPEFRFRPGEGLVADGGFEEIDLASHSCW